MDNNIYYYIIYYIELKSTYNRCNSLKRNVFSNDIFIES